MPTPKGGRPVYNPSPAIQTSINQGGRIKAVANPSAITDWQQVVDKDENLRGLTPEAATNYLRATWGLPSTYKLDRTGNIVDAHGYVMRNLWWIGPAALVGASAIGAAVGGGGGAAALPTSVEGVTAIHAVPPAVSIGGTYGTGVVAPVVAATTGNSVVNAIKKGAGSLSARDWADLAFRGVGIGTTIWGANKASDASKEAADIEAAAYREGLDFLKTQWAKYNEDFKPYLDAGHAAVGRMSGALEGTTPPPMPASVSARLNGRPTLGTFGQPQPRPTTQTGPPLRPTIERPPNAPPVSTTMPVTQPAPTPAPAPTESLGTYGQPTSTTMPVGGQPKLVSVQAPDGEIREMPERMANAFLARGARRIA